MWNPDVWSSYYAGGAEILDYFRRTCDKFGLRRFVKLRHRVDKAEWQEKEGLWRVSVTDLHSGDQFTDEAEMLVNAMGFLK